MIVLRFVATVTAFLVVATSAADDMGPAAFMWPEDRVWSGAVDNTGPCGSVASAGNRTSFPLTHGNIALVDQNEAYRVELSISYMENPTSNTDFATIIPPEAMAELDKGHTCVPVADAPSSVKAGTNATLQIKYTANFDKPENETFYACADITYVDFSNFKEKVPCFNATEPGDETDTSPTHAPSPNPSKDGDSGKSGLSGGAIAGMVVGVVGGITLLAGAALLIYRRKQQRLRIIRQQNSARAVKWDEQPRDSNSNRSVRMQKLS